MSDKVQQRHKTLLAHLVERSIVTVNELAQYTGVSPETIRKDLLELESRDLIVRIHGGAALPRDKQSAAPFDLRTTKNTRSKSKIAKAAARLIRPDSTILLEGCTTCMELAKVLQQMPELLITLTIITNSFPIAAIFGYGQACSRLFFLGGWCLCKEYSAKGHYTTKMLTSFYADLCFLSASSISDNLMLTAFIENDADFQKQALKCAKETVLLIDCGKFDARGILIVAPLSSFSHIVADRECPKEMRTALEKRGLNVSYI